MRLRILATAPLPELRAWFSVESPDTIADLKRDLCVRVNILREVGLRGSDISLVLDEFELLDESSFSVLRDGDLIHVRKAVSVKRKVSSQDRSPPYKRRRLSPVGKSTRQTTKSVASPSIPDSTSTSASDSSSSSSTSSSSSSESDSDSSSSSGTSRSSPIKPMIIKAARSHITPLVPPGQGKPTTHSRNKRRRIKRKHDQANASLSSTVPNGTSIANAQPLGPKRPQEDVHDDESLPEHSVMMASLRNKNKKRGFKNSMASPLPLKIIFANGMDNTSGLDAQTALPFAATEPDFEFISVPRLIPPSEKQDKGMLPANMFVTSIDVENGARQKNNRKKSCEAVTEEGWLDYGQEDVQDAPIAVDFTAAESGWDDLIRVTDSAQLSSGQTVGWKALTLNPSTFSPEVLVNIARIIKCDTEKVVVQPLPRPGAVVNDGENIEEVYMWHDILNEWRLV